MMERWPPYLVGAGIGVLRWIAFLLSDKPIGCSTASARIAGMIAKEFAGERVRDRAHYRRFAPEVDWELMLVAGVGVRHGHDARLMSFPTPGPGTAPHEDSDRPQIGVDDRTGVAVSVRNMPGGVLVWPPPRTPARGLPGAGNEASGGGNR